MSKLSIKFHNRFVICSKGRGRHDGRLREVDHPARRARCAASSRGAEHQEMIVLLGGESPRHCTSERLARRHGVVYLHRVAVRLLEILVDRKQGVDPVPHVCGLEVHVLAQVVTRLAVLGAGFLLRAEDISKNLSVSVRASYVLLGVGPLIVHVASEALLD